MRRNRPMGVFKKPPVFMLDRDLFVKTSKATWADVAWNLAALAASRPDDPECILGRIQQEIETTNRYREAK